MWRLIISYLKCYTWGTLATRLRVDQHLIALDLYSYSISKILETEFMTGTSTYKIRVLKSNRVFGKIKHSNEYKAFENKLQKPSNTKQMKAIQNIWITLW